MRSSRDVAAALDAISTIRLDRAGLGDVVTPIHEVVGGPITVINSLRADPRTGDLAIDFFYGTGFAMELEPAREAYARVLVGQGSGFHSYVPNSPARWQRNRALTCDELEARLGEAPARSALYPLMGATDHKTLRVLVCDGPSLLAWVGIVQPDTLHERQRTALAALVPALRRRLIAERVLSAHARAYETLHAVMEETASPAYLVQRGSRTVHANAAAGGHASRKLLDQLRAWVAAPPPGVAVTELRDTDGAALSLVVVTRPTPSDQVHAFSRELGLTPAQLRVLRQILDGQSNATIAARLGVAERTVEAHLTAIYAKAQVPSRGALVAVFLRRSPGSAVDV